MIHDTPSHTPCHPMNSILKLMTVWRITGKILELPLFLITQMLAYNGVLTILGLACFCVLCFCKS